eukprot:437953-Pelagomonas_calceolata.AAC.1
MFEAVHEQKCVMAAAIPANSARHIYGVNNSSTIGLNKLFAVSERVVDASTKKAPSRTIVLVSTWQKDHRRSLKLGEAQVHTSNKGKSAGAEMLPFRSSKLRSSNKCFHHCYILTLAKFEGLPLHIIALAQGWAGQGLELGAQAQSPVMDASAYGS